jgi:hypothetical protein
MCIFCFEIGQVLMMEDKNCVHFMLLLNRTSIDDVGQELHAFFSSKVGQVLTMEDKNCVYFLVIK